MTVAEEAVGLHPAGQVVLGLTLRTTGTERRELHRAAAAAALAVAARNMLVVRGRLVA